MRVRPTLGILAVLLSFGMVAVGPVAADEPYVAVYQYPGYIDYAVAWEVAPAGAPCVAVPTPIYAVKNCGGVRSGASMNGEVGIDMDDTVHTLVVELSYAPSTPTSSLQLDVLCPDVPRGSSGAVLDTSHACYFLTAGDSYLKIRIDRAHWEEHGYTVNGTWSARVFGNANDAIVDGLGAGATTAQPFDLYVSVFYHGPAPDDYTAIDG